MTMTFAQPIGAFRHQALLYAGLDDFLEGTVQFIRDGLAGGESVLVVESAAKIALHRAELGGAAVSVLFADMAAVGANPARIIPAWRDFVTQHGGAGRRFRGIGEPIWSGRSPAELIECQRHESLLNVAFGLDTPWWLLCPYDTQALEPSVIDEARRSHPFIADGDVHRPSFDFRGLADSGAPFDVPLPDPPPAVPELVFGSGDLMAAGGLVSESAADAGLGTSRAADLVLAVNEILSNSIQHGGGRGTLRIWHEAGSVVCEIRDAGQFDCPLADRERPVPGGAGPRGLWLANQLCDLVQVRSFFSGTVVRLHMQSKRAHQSAPIGQATGSIRLG
jgi:anti-sigma regulatory factor (Ser/Thr protein kinase)